VEQGVEQAEEGETSREGSTKEGQSVWEPKLLTRVWIEKLHLLTMPSRSSGQLRTKLLDWYLWVV